MIFQFDNQKFDIQSTPKHYYSGKSGDSLRVQPVTIKADKLTAMKRANQADSTRMLDMRSRSEASMKTTIDFYRNQQFHNGSLLKTPQIQMSPSLSSMVINSKAQSNVEEIPLVSVSNPSRSTSSRHIKTDFRMTVNPSFRKSVKTETSLAMKKREEIIAKNEAFFGDLEDKIIGGRFKKIPMNKTSIHWNKPLYKYDLDVVQDEMNPTISDEKIGKKAFSKYFRLDSQEYTWEACVILDRLESGKYVIRWESNGATKAVDSLNVILQEGSPFSMHDLEIRREKALYKRYKETYFNDLRSKFTNVSNDIEHGLRKQQTRSPVIFSGANLRRVLIVDCRLRLVDRKYPQECMEKLFTEFQEEYYFKIREFHYFYLINESDAQELCAWLFGNQQAEELSAGPRNYIQPSFGYQIISPTPGNSQTPLFQTIKTQDKLEHNIFKAKSSSRIRSKKLRLLGPKPSSKGRTSTNKNLRCRRLELRKQLFVESHSSFEEEIEQ
jgi:hypothetical protein